MSHTPTPDFTDTELWVVRSTLKERYGHDVELEFAQTETALPEAGGMAWCPTLFWSAKGANFAIIKTGAKRYRPVFYYHPETQLGTGTDGYDEIGDAAIGVLQVEADHMRKQKIKIDDSRDGGRSGPSMPSRGTTPSLEGGGKTASGDGRDAGGTTSGRKEVGGVGNEPPRATAASDVPVSGVGLPGGGSRGTRASCTSPGAVAGTAADETPAKDDKSAPDKPNLSPLFWGD